MKSWPALGLFLISGLCAIYALVLYGQALFPAPPAPPLALNAMAGKSNALLSTLFALLTVILVARLVGAAFKLLGQPQVIGEVVGGILLGPSFLGTLAPEVAQTLLPPEVAPVLGVIAQIGVLLFMFVIGLEMDLSLMKRAGKTAVAISKAGILFPFLTGMGLAFVLYSKYAPLGVNFTSFALFLGVSLSITAFPVLARILSDTGLQKSEIGALALTCAAIGDASAWCLLALVVGLMQSSLSGAIFTTTFTVLYVVVMLVVIKPLFARLIPWMERSTDRISETSLAVVLISLLISAVASEYIGVHALFGGFLLGAIIPHQSRVAEDLTNRLQDLVRVFFLPGFFAFTGMRTQIGLISGRTDILFCVLIIVAASLGKFGGTYIAARFSGMSNRESSILGFLMNTRGLVELIVLNVGMDLGVLSPRLFTMLVIMAITTTMMTGPALKLLIRKPLPN